MTLLKIALLLIFFYFKVNCELIGLVTLSRHGQRTPVINIPNDTRKIHWSAEPGQLLNSGKNLQYNLGIWFRRRYLTFLPNKYSPKDIHIQSTDVDRVLMSAYCNLAGLYPPRGTDIWKWTINWQPIPVHVMPDYYLYRGDISLCNQFVKEWTTYIKNSPLIFNTENKKLFQYIGSYLDIDLIENPIPLIDYFDTLHTQKSAGFPLPEWAEPIYPKWQEIAALLFQTMSNSTELAQMTLGGFAEHIINHFDGTINGTNEYKYSMNFGHDFSIVGFLNILTNNKNFLPYYGCTLLFELYRNLGSNPNEYYLKLFLKNKDDLTEMEIKGCGVPCDYMTFRRILKKYATSESQWKEICD